MTSDEFAARYDDVIRHPRMLRLFRDSGYFNVGYWVDGITDQVLACDRLVDEIASFIPPTVRLVIDVGCGLGSGTRRLAAHFPGANIVGGNISRWQLSEATRRGLGATIEMDAASMPLASGIADAVVAMESAQHFKTRKRFLDEAFRVLRSDGRIILADMLFNNPEPVGTWMLPPENYVPDPGAYGQLLADAGFHEITVRDVTIATWTPHCAAMRAATPEFAAQIDGFERSLSCYVFASGRKA